MSGVLTVDSPHTLEPINPTPTSHEVLELLNEAGFDRNYTLYQVQLACACGYSRPVVESHIASLLCRGAGYLCYKGPQRATVRLGMTAMAHHGVAMGSIRQQRLSALVQKFCRLLRLRRRNINHLNKPKN